MGVLRGDGVFERFLVIAGRPRHFVDHLARLVRSAGQLELAVPGEPAWRSAVEAGIAAWQGNQQWEMRLVCTRGPEEGGDPTAYVLGQELSEDVLRAGTEGFAVVTLQRELASGLGPDRPWLLLGAKTLSYAFNMAVERWARSRGADEAILVGTDGLVWEASKMAVVAAFGRRLVSPPASTGILDSISVANFFRAASAAGWATARENLTVDDLFAADGLWLSASLCLGRVHTLDGKALGECPAHQELAALYAAS
jgi:4-amino-4-deoxychorismate lyase